MNHISYFYPKTNVDLNFLKNIPLEYNHKNVNLYWLSFILSNLENINKFNNSILYTNNEGKKIIELFGIPFKNIKILNKNINIPNELENTYNLLNIFLEQNNPFIFTNKNSFFINYIPSNINNFDIGIFFEKLNLNFQKKLVSLIEAMKQFYSDSSSFLKNYNYKNLNINVNAIIINDTETLKNYSKEMINIIENNLENIKMQLHMSKKIIRMKHLENYLNYAIINNFLINYYSDKNKIYHDMELYNKNPLYEYYIPNTKFYSESVLYQIGKKRHPEYIEILENYLNI